VIRVPNATQSLLLLWSTLAVLLYLLPTFVALARDAVARNQVLILNLAFGWTCAAWVWALVLAFGARRPQAHPVPRRQPRLPAEESDLPTIYRDGVYLVSRGVDTHTWAVREDGRWSIVYEVGGVDRLVGNVRESDIPFNVLAQALECLADAP
jgi:hypothetical protein